MMNFTLLFTAETISSCTPSLQIGAVHCLERLHLHHKLVLDSRRDCAAASRGPWASAAFERR